MARAEVHLVAQIPAAQVDDELVGLLDVLQRVLRPGAARPRPVRREHDHRRKLGDGVEEAVGSEVRNAVDAPAADPGDRPRRHQRLQRIELQPVLLRIVVEHAKPRPLRSSTALPPRECASRGRCGTIRLPASGGGTCDGPMPMPKARTGVGGLPGCAYYRSIVHRRGVPRHLRPRTGNVSAMGQFGFGQAVRRVEDVRLVTGRGRYTDDMTLGRQTYAYMLRSPHAPARIGGIDTLEAKAAPSVPGVRSEERRGGHEG